MSYFAVAAVHDSDGWSAAEVDLSGVADLDEVADRLCDVNPSADVSLLFIEVDDTYLVILRLDEGQDLRVFGSDAAFAEESRLGELLIGDLKAPAIDVGEAVGEAAEDEEAERTSPETDIEPVGDADLLADLGVPAARLLSLCAKEGMLPSDVTAELCETIGCGDVVEELREA
jgi:putative tRNA adenosine deaminase-associated protein